MAEKKIADGQAQIDSNRRKAEGGRIEALDAIKKLDKKLSEVNEGIEKLNAEKRKAGDGLKKAGEISAQLVQAKDGLDGQTALLRQDRKSVV